MCETTVWTGWLWDEHAEKYEEEEKKGGLAGFLYVVIPSHLSSFKTLKVTETLMQAGAILSDGEALMGSPTTKQLADQPSKKIPRVSRLSRLVKRISSKGRPTLVQATERCDDAQPTQRRKNEFSTWQCAYSAQERRGSQQGEVEAASEEGS